MEDIKPSAVLRVLSLTYAVIVLMLVSTKWDALLVLPALAFPLWLFFGGSSPFTVVMLCICKTEEEAVAIRDQVTQDFDVLIMVDAAQLIESEIAEEQS